MKSLVSIPSRGATHAREWIRKERVAIYISIMSLAESHVLSLGFGQYLSVWLAPGTESSHILYSWASGIYQWSETQGHTNRRAKVLGQSLCVIWQVLNPWHFSGCFNSDTYDLRWSYNFSRLLHCLRSGLKVMSSLSIWATSQRAN